MDSVAERYRALHRIAERSGEEYETAQYIVAALTAMGYAPKRIGSTGVYADLVAGEELPYILLRADIDALPIEEKSGVPFASEHAGVMHACGHDAHTSMLLTAAERLRGEKLSHNIRFLFQPAEELINGADLMIGLGALPKNLIGCFAMHVWPQLEAGKIAFARMASSDMIQMDIVGRSVHCARCDEGANALLTAADIALTFERIRKREGNVVVFLGESTSGTAHNIVADRAEMAGSLRTYGEETRTRLMAELEEEAKAAGERYGTEVTLVWSGSTPAIDNDAGLMKQLAALLGDRIVDFPASYTGEDFAYYQREAAGVMLWMGLGDVPLLHTDTFFVPEHLLETGVDAWVKIARHAWENGKS